MSQPVLHTSDSFTTSSKAPLGEITATLFAQQAVYQLSDSDFNLNTKDAITTKWDDCMIILFYDEGPESKDLVRVWAAVGSQVVGPVFGACNLRLSRGVAKAFANLNMKNGTYKPFALKGIPFILTYQNGSPVGFYNGDREVQAIVDFSLTLACKADYYEPLQLPAGKTVYQQDNISVAGWTEYKPQRTSSIQYKAGDPVRRFDVSRVPTSTAQQFVPASTVPTSTVSTSTVTAPTQTVQTIPSAVQPQLLIPTTVQTATPLPPHPGNPS